MGFTNFSFSLVSPTGPWIKPNVTSSDRLQVGDFTFNGLPITISPGISTTLTVTYNPQAPGNETVFLTGFSNGGSAHFTASGIAGTQSEAIVEFQTPDGSGWVPFTNSTPFKFGTVYEGQTRNLLFRLTNGGGPLAVPLSVAVSKPPHGIPGIIGKANNADLAEGSIISAVRSQTAQMFCAVPKSQVNLSSYNGSTVWTMNTNDPDLGKLFIEFSCQATSEQAGPLLRDGTAQYGYTGCVKEGNPGRQLAIQAYTDAVNTNAKRINTCSSLGYIFAGTEFASEFWCGMAIPIWKGDNANCNYGCAGNVDQTCGGNGILKDSTWLSLFSDCTRFNGNFTSPPLQLPPSVGQYSFIGCYAEPSGKTVALNATSSNVMTVELCASWCGSLFPCFGLEYSQECTCGNTLNPESTLVDPSQCNYTHKGSNSEYCSGSSRMQVYRFNASLPTLPTSTISSVMSSICLPTLVTTSTPNSPTTSTTSVINSSSTSNALVTPSSTSTSQIVVVPTTISSSIASTTTSSTIHPI